MIRDILKIIRIYVKKYFIAIIILLLGFVLFTILAASKQLNGLKETLFPIPHAHRASFPQMRTAWSLHLL